MMALVIQSAYKYNNQIQILQTAGLGEIARAGREGAESARCNVLAQRGRDYGWASQARLTPLLG